MNQFVLYVLVSVMLQVLSSIAMPEGKMKKFVLSVISLCLFALFVVPMCQYLM